jgi:hypothetical protein
MLFSGSVFSRNNYYIQLGLLIVKTTKDHFLLFLHLCRNIHNLQNELGILEKYQYFHKIIIKPLCCNNNNINNYFNTSLIK